MSTKREILEARVSELRGEITDLRNDLSDEVDELNRRRKVATNRFSHFAVHGIGVGVSLLVVKSLVGAVMGVLNDLPRKPRQAPRGLTKK